jgi:hypothetical protein
MMNHQACMNSESQHKKRECRQVGAETLEGLANCGTTLTSRMPVTTSATTTTAVGYVRAF